MVVFIDFLVKLNKYFPFSLSHYLYLSPILSLSLSLLVNFVSPHRQFPCSPLPLSFALKMQRVLFLYAFFPHLIFLLCEYFLIFISSSAKL